MTSESARPHRRVDIGIVDDEEIIRVSLCRLCEALGLSATAYASGHEFIEGLERGVPRPDCLVLDAHMPQMTGLELQQHLVGRGISLPIVIYSADDAPKAQARYLAAGVAEYVRKPAGAEELLAAINRAMTAGGLAPEGPPPDTRTPRPKAGGTSHLH
jgi:FixJ family two-component response regulator